MPTSSFSHLATELRADLDRLAEILQKNGICNDVSPIRQAMATIEATEEGNTFRLCYDLTRLVMRLGNLDGCFPPSVKDISCTLSVHATTSFLTDPSPPHDPFDSLTINFVFEGVIPAQRHKHIQSWHFDRNPRPKEGENEPVDAHPIYHFHFGGRKMHDHANKLPMPSESAFGKVVLLDGPRWAHPPMDVVLSVDFVLSNFRGSLRTQLAKTNREYLRMVSRSQSRIWKPYSETLASLWTRSPVPDSRWTPASIWPQFLAEPLSATLSVPNKT